MNLIKLFILFLFFAIGSSSAWAKPKIAVLDFELKDLTLLPGVPEEIARTASVKPMLEKGLQEAGFEVVSIPLTAQQEATSGVGYLFDHSDAAAQLGRRFDADYVLVGRLHKPSFLFVYLLAHLVDVENQRLLADYSSEVKGTDRKLTGKGVESLKEKIKRTLN